MKTALWLLVCCASLVGCRPPNPPARRPVRPPNAVHLQPPAGFKQTTAPGSLIGYRSAAGATLVLTRRTVPGLSQPALRPALERTLTADRNQEVGAGGFKVTGHVNATIADRPALVMDAELTTPAGRRRLRQYGILAGEQWYVLTAEAGAEQFGELQAQFDAAAQSLRLEG
ncbi:MAG: hypothetical protein IT204_18485 [Fimbriimonadaceae bacterium]|nr:hypothetical protein [Fimbriimonadaceae bacterium]